MFTGDRDLVQLVDKSKNNNTHTILFSPAHKKLYTYQGFSEWLDTEDVSETSDDVFDVLKVSVSPENQAKKLLKELVKKKKASIIEIDPEDFRFRKVLTGDAGDNVPPAYYYTSKNRRYGISEKKATAIIAEFKEKHGHLSHMYLYNEEYVTDLANMVIRVMNAKHMSREQIIANIKSNVNLMVLAAESIPEGILDEMFKYVESKMNQKGLQLKTISTMKSLLEGTEYAKEVDSSFKASFFKDDDDDEGDLSFIKDTKKQDKIF
jgi:5'-3' exonuclease